MCNIGDGKATASGKRSAPGAQTELVIPPS
jgi:hypothetical protein